MLTRTVNELVYFHLLRTINSTPEMLAFLEQTSVLGCRVVDAVSSGKAKQLIHNSKDLIWNGIELAVDPATTIALAEVTAHLCHALEEAADSITYLEAHASRKARTSTTAVTPRRTRDEQNKETYLQPNQVTDYQAEPIETVILSSLGVETDPNSGVYGGSRQPEENDDDDDTTAVRSIPSNVDFPGDNSKSMKDQQDTLWRSREESVNVNILRERILHEGRPMARPSMKLSGDNITHTSDQETNRSTDYQSQNDDDLRRLVLDLEEVPQTDRGVAPLQTNTINTTYIREVNSKLEEYGSVQVDGTKESSGAVRFYQLVDEYMEKDRLKKKEQDQTQQDGDVSAQYTGSDRMQVLKAKVRKLKEGKQQRDRSRRARDDCLNPRRTSKYPTFVMYLSYVLVGGLIMFWTMFGLYGVYTIGQVAYFQGATPRNFLFPSQNGQNSQRPSSGDSAPQTNSNEMVIRIVREVVHVREDGSTIDGSFASPDASFSKEEMNSVMECVAAMEKESTKKVKK
jgi:hypothetical protein